MSDSISWIDDVDYRDADPMLRAIYTQVLSPDGQLDNLYRGFSLSPQTILPADTLYKAAMHHSNNVLPKVFSELIGTYVAMLTGCDYARAHHGHNFISLSADAGSAQQILNALTADITEESNNDNAGVNTNTDSPLGKYTTAKDAAALHYVRKLCLHPAQVDRSDITTLQEAGWTDPEISETAQVVAMFSYFVRVINGVGIRLGDEKLGLY